MFPKYTVTLRSCGLDLGFHIYLVRAAFTNHLSYIGTVFMIAKNIIITLIIYTTETETTLVWMITRMYMF